MARPLLKYIKELPRNTQRPKRERGGECSELPLWSRGPLLHGGRPQSHGRLSAVAQAGKSVVRGLLPGSGDDNEN